MILITTLSETKVFTLICWRLSSSNSSSSRRMAFDSESSICSSDFNLQALMQLLPQLRDHLLLFHEARLVGRFLLVPLLLLLGTLLLNSSEALIMLANEHLQSFWLFLSSAFIILWPLSIDHQFRCIFARNLIAFKQFVARAVGFTVLVVSQSVLQVFAAVVIDEFPHGRHYEMGVRSRGMDHLWFETAWAKMIMILCMHKKTIIYIYIYIYI